MNIRFQKKAHQQSGILSCAIGCRSDFSQTFISGVKPRCLVRSEAFAEARKLARRDPETLNFVTTYQARKVPTAAGSVLVLKSFVGATSVAPSSQTTRPPNKIRVCDENRTYNPHSKLRCVLWVGLQFDIHSGAHRSGMSEFGKPLRPLPVGARKAISHSGRTPRWARVTGANSRNGYTVLPDAPPADTIRVRKNERAMEYQCTVRAN